jgi:hypothetical protein
VDHEHYVVDGVPLVTPEYDLDPSLYWSVACQESRKLGHLVKWYGVGLIEPHKAAYSSKMDDRVSEFR